MATDKLYTVAGISTLNGDTKPRFANDVMRVKVLAKNGHSNVELVERPEAMPKIDAVKFLMTIDEFATPEAQAVLGEYLERNGETEPTAVVKAPTTKAPKAEVKAPKVTPQVPALDGMTPLGITPKATVTQAADEDKPFGVA